MHICKSVVTSVAVLLLCGQSQAQGVAPVQLNIPAQGMSDALNEFARQSGLQVLIDWEDSREVKSPALSGAFTPQAALERLLADSGLHYQYLDSRTISIRAAKGKSESDSSTTFVSQNAADLRVAQSEIPSPSEGEDKNEVAGKSADSSGSKIQEIIVTAQKRAERLQDVPVPVGVIDAETLVSSNQLRLQDFYTKVPGLIVSYDGLRGGLPVVAIRGIRSSNTDNPTVGVLVDDLAYGSSSSVGGGLWVPEVDPGDLARVEVLRGPQGTLYGASSMGGLLKFVTIAPSTDRLSGRVQAGTSSIRNGDQFGYSLRGSVNVPIGDVFAIRASGFTREEPGYIDNVQGGERAVNRTSGDGGRLSALWQASEDFSLKLSALFQDIKVDGSSHINPSLGELKQNAVPETGWLNRKSLVYDATINGSIGIAELTAVSGYSVNTRSSSLDATALFNAGISFDEYNKTKKFTQELRITAPIGTSLEWLIGAFYADEDSRFYQPRMSINTLTGTRISLLALTDTYTQYGEYAAFSNLTWSITDRFDIQVGGRFAKGEKDSRQGARSTAGIDTLSQLGLNEDAFTYLLTPRFKASADLMMYARLASGYRAGGLNPLATLPVNADLPLGYKPDKTQNYEIGIKGDILDHALSFDASFYYIDWKDIQLSLVATGRTVGYFDNGGRAKSQGMEVSVESKPLTGLTIAAWAAWNEAQLVEDFPVNTQAIRGFDGNRLPFSSRWSGNISADQEFAVSGNVAALIGGSISYVGKRLGLFTGPAQASALPSLPRQVYPAYTKIDLRAGLRFDAWAVDLYLNNLADEGGVLSGGLGNTFPTVFSYIQPRTAGVSLSRTF